MPHPGRERWIPSVANARKVGPHLPWDQWIVRWRVVTEQQPGTMPNDKWRAAYDEAVAQFRKKFR
jgi:hypothetical protein